MFIMLIEISYIINLITSKHSRLDLIDPPALNIVAFTLSSKHIFINLLSNLFGIVLFKQ